MKKNLKEILTELISIEASITQLKERRRNLCHPAILSDALDIRFTILGSSKSYPKELFFNDKIVKITEKNGILKVKFKQIESVK